MVKRRGLPGRGGVTHLALLGHPGRQMVRVRRGAIVLQVTGDAGSTRKVEIAPGVALVALQLGVAAGERKPDCVVIEIRGLPGCCAMALLAALWKTEGDVVGIAGFLEVRQVASDAGCRCARVFSAHVASGTVERRVHSSQGEVRESEVVKLRAQPGVDGVALFALRDKP